MKQNRVEEVQRYLAKRGIVVSETAIINAAIDIARRDGIGGIYAFAEEFKEEEE